MKLSFTPADYQLIAMQLSYFAEDHVRNVGEISDPSIEKELVNKMLLEYQDRLGDKNINFVNNVPQYSKEKVTIENYRGGAIEKETGFHMNAITKGSPDNPDQIVITFPGTDFSDSL